MYACNKPGSAANVRWEFDNPTITVGFPCSSAGKESACNAGVPGSIPELGRSAGEGMGYPLQYSWVSTVAQLVKSPPAMREGDPGWIPESGRSPWRIEKPTHSSNLTWRIPWTITKSQTQLSDSPFHFQYSDKNKNKWSRGKLITRSLGNWD